MTNSQNVELEAAKFLHKLIQDSKDEPTKLATKLYVILQHMRSSGKEDSMPYQVISRAMETVIKQHNLDIEALMSSRLPLAGGTQIVDSTSLQLAGGAPDSYPPSESTVPVNFGSSSYDNHGFAAKISKDRSMEVFPATPSTDFAVGKSAAGKPLDHGGTSTLVNANKIIQGGVSSSITDTNMLRSVGLRERGKSPAAQAPSTGMPFKEQQLKQLRAQCLVFLAFRNGLTPKKLHLEIALGNFYSKEDGPCRDLIDQKEEQVKDPSNIPEASRQSERLINTKGHSSFVGFGSSKGAEVAKTMEDKGGQPSILFENAQDRRNLLATRRELDAEMPNSETVVQTLAPGEQCESNTRHFSINNHGFDLKNSQQQIGSTIVSSLDITPAEDLKLEESSGTGTGCETDAFKASLPATVVTHELVPQRKDDAVSLSQSPTDSSVLGNRRCDGKLASFPLKDQWKPVLGMSGQSYPAMMKNVSHSLQTDREADDISISTDGPPSPKHTTLEKWILEHQKRKVISEQSRALKQQKTEQRIAARFDKLKENVSCSEDISAKTRSVIETKKLQLLKLQRSLRRDILNDFFKPIATEIDRLKSIKKHRIGRRSKQIERYEQKMKEDRQKRIRERQMEFFSEMEFHRERLEDVFKMRRERWKGFNKSSREFHKRKERFHREKIDRIQREKINLLKINDVEGYLRMVKDAKSDRVKQLLKETEKYLQKLGSKLKEAKALERHFETDMDESSGVEENEIIFENEDEKDQAKHYMESNEKYYLMAHSIKENIGKQPTCLVGGKLREYQMNGLRWLVSLYNNHLNGILADEMGLGKTVQVISLICYLMETKNDRGPFLVVVPSSVLPGWESEINFWAPSIHKIVYSGLPEERRRLFKEQIAPQKFNVLLTTYEYLMNKHDRPKLSKVHWHYLIIDEGHRIKNASCKLNAELKHYRSNHRLLLTGTPLQNNLEELWALLNFLLPNIFNSSEDFSQWFNKPFESNGDNSPEEALLSEEENLLIINRLHQVLRPFVLRRLKHKVEHQLPEKIERLVRCEASGYQKLLMKRVEENLGAIGTSKARSVHNSVMELRNICNHPYLCQLHVEEVHDFIPKHYLPNIVRLCGKLEMLDRLLPKLKATDHRVLLFSTMTRLLDVMEDYLCWKQYKYLRLDGHTSGGDRGALIEKFNEPGSPYFIFLLSIRAGGVGVNLQAADTVIIFDTDWNPQVDLQAQARAHRIGQKKEVLVLRLETVQTVEEQVRAAAEHKLGVANQSITAGFFDNNTSAEDRREYLEALLRECKKEEATPVLDDDALNDLIARSGSEIDIFELVDKQRREEEMVAWQNLFSGKLAENSESVPPLPSRLLVDDDLKQFYKAMKICEVPNSGVGSNAAMKQKSGSLGGLDTQHYGRGKRTREVRSYEEQWTEEEFERMCQSESLESPIMKEEMTGKILPMGTSDSVLMMGETKVAAVPQLPQHPTTDPLGQQIRNTTPPSKRGRGRPKRTTVETSAPIPLLAPLGASACREQWTGDKSEKICKAESLEFPMMTEEMTGKMPSMTTSGSVVVQGEAHIQAVVVVKGETQMPAVSQLSQHQTAESLAQQGKEAIPSSKRGRGRPKRMTKETTSPIPVPASLGAAKVDESSKVETAPMVSAPDSLPSFTPVRSITGTMQQLGIVPNSQLTVSPSLTPAAQPAASPSPSGRGRGRGQKPQTGGEPPRRRGKRQTIALQAVSVTASPSGTGKPDMEIKGTTVSSSTVPPKTVPVSLGLVTKEVLKGPSSVPSVIALPSPSDSSKLGVGSQVSISSHLKVPDQNPAPGTSVVASIGQQETGVVSALTSQETPILSSANPGAPSIMPSLSVKKQGRGRARKAQSGEETSQRKRRRQEPLVPVANQDSNSTAPVEKKTRRKANISKQGNESQELATASQSVPSGFDDLYTGQIPQSSNMDADVALDKSKDPYLEQNADEVLASKSQVGENLPSTSSTLELPVSALSLPLSESSNQPLGESVVHQDNRDPLGVSSVASNPEMPEISEGAPLPIVSSTSVEVTKDQTLNIETPKGASIFGSTVQASDCEKSESRWGKEPDEIIESAKDPELDKSIVNLSIRAEVSSISVGMTKDQSSNTGTVDAAPTFGSVTLAGDSGECEPPCGNEKDKMVENATSLNVDESIASDDMPKGITISGSEISKDRIDNESWEIVAEHEKDNILADGHVLTQSSIEVEVRSLESEQERSKHLCGKRDAEKKESEDTTKAFDTKPESIVSRSLQEESFPILSTSEKVNLSLERLESGSHDIGASLVLKSEEVGIHSNSVEEDAEEKRRDVVPGEALLSLSEFGNSQCLESSTLNTEVPVDDLSKESFNQCEEKPEVGEGKVSDLNEVHLQGTETCRSETKSAAISSESMNDLGQTSEEKSPSCIMESSKMEALNVEPQTVNSDNQFLLSSVDDVDGKIPDMDGAVVSNPEPEMVKFKSQFVIESSVDVKAGENSNLDVTVVSHPEPQSESQYLLDSAVDAQGSKESGLDEAVVSDPKSQSKSQFVLDSAVDAQGSKDFVLDEAVVSGPEPQSKSQSVLDSAVDAHGSKESGLDEAVVSDPESHLKSKFVLDSAVDALESRNFGLDEAVVSGPEPQSKSQFVLDSVDDAQGSTNYGSDEAIVSGPEPQFESQLGLDSAVDDVQGSKNSGLDEPVVPGPEPQSQSQVLDSAVDAQESKNSSLDETVVLDPESQSKSQFVLDSAVDAQGSEDSSLNEAVVSDPVPQSQSLVVLDSSVDAQGSKNSGSDEASVSDPELQSKSQFVLDYAVDAQGSKNSGFTEAVVSDLYSAVDAQGSTNSGLDEAVVSNSESQAAKSENQVELEHSDDVQVIENFKEDNAVVMNPEPQNMTSENKLALDSAFDLQGSNCEPQTMKSQSQDDVPEKKNSNVDETVVSKPEEAQPSQIAWDGVDLVQLGEGNFETVSAVSLADNLKDDVPCDMSSVLGSHSSADDLALAAVTDKCSSETENTDKNDPQQ